MLHRRSIGFMAFASLAAVSAAFSAPAAPANRPRTVADFVAASDLVFHGTVVRIDYALSEPVKGEPEGIPHTFVTYRVESVIHGSADAGEITLRFLGGLDVDGTYLAVSVAPQFDVGDEDVLFVRDNGDSGCPLVADHRGRLRIIDGQAYTDTGRSLTHGRDGMLVTGERYDLPEVATTIVNDQIFVTSHDSEAIEGPSDAMRGEELVAFISASATAIPAPANTFASVHPGAPFVVLPFTPVELRDSKADERSVDIDGSETGTH